MIIVIAVPPSNHLTGAGPFLLSSPTASVAVTSSPVMLSAAKHLCAQRARRLLSGTNVPRVTFGGKQHQVTIALRLTFAGMSLKINKSSLIHTCYFHLPDFVYEKVPFYGHFFYTVTINK